eukprot:CAMPEP_0181141396 /NCGR_PEP_ID=MMETSP1071-20121207/35800_1 /TAXON_ID=35127 /ORGANISM="Thalassiosira sp., Strain NH16" /LENGTH=1329 /DNA_ID=CAMNT_0023228381 /DNA_START=239 /DNA_END=4228 /DNA_ORIENTATION=-
MDVDPSPRRSSLSSIVPIFFVDGFSGSPVPSFPTTMVTGGAPSSTRRMEHRPLAPLKGSSTTSTRLWVGGDHQQQQRQRRRQERLESSELEGMKQQRQSKKGGNQSYAGYHDQETAQEYGYFDDKGHRNKKISKWNTKKKKKKGSSWKGGGWEEGTTANNSPARGGKSSSSFAAARAFNTKLTKCQSTSELLTAFMEQTSSSSSSDNDDTGGTSAPKSTAATHLAGANKANSVNFSTCLHRLARFANNNNNNNSNNNNNNGDAVDERKRVLSDPRFALLVCSMAEMAAGCDPTISIVEGNTIMGGYNGGVKQRKEDIVDVVDELEEADDVLNAIAGVTTRQQRGTNDEADSRSIDNEESAESIMARLKAPGGKNAFSSRECSNVCWALAKLRMAPPGTALPVGRVVTSIDEGEEEDDDPDDGSGEEGGRDGPSSSSSSSGRSFSSADEMSLDVISSSLEVRMRLFEEARNRKNGLRASDGGWIPELSRLAGKVMDLVAIRTVDEYAARTTNVAATTGGAQFNPQEMASVLWAFAKAKRGDGALFDAVAEELMRQTEFELGRGGQGPKPQELSNTIWAFATAGIRGDTQVELVKFMADALDEGRGQFFGFQFKPQELSNTAWALATLHSRRNTDLTDTDARRVREDDGMVRVLRWVAKSLAERVDSFKPQELSNSIWAFSTVGFGYDEACGTNNHNDYVHLATDDPSGDKELVFETLEVIAENALPRLDRFKAQELNNMAWGFARLGHRSERTEKLFAGVAKEMIRRTWQFKPQDVGTTLWSFATAEYIDLEAFRAGVSRLNFRQIRSFKPQEMSNTLWALATAGFGPEHWGAFDTTLVPASKRPTKQMISNDPITECFAAVASETMRRPYDFKDQELKDVLWSFSKIGVRHPALFQKMAKHIVGRNGRGFSSFSSQGLGNTLWSFAKQAQLSLEVIEMLGDDVKLVSTGRLAVYETSCLDNGEDVIKRLFVRAAEAGIDMGLARFTNQDLSNTVWAYSTMGMLHSGFFKEAENEVINRLRSKKSKFRGQEIANILWSYATLNAQPEMAMVDALSSFVVSECHGDEYSIARMFGQRQELANLAWSCAVLGRYPKELMDILYTGLVGTGNDPEQMKRVFNDDGLQKSSIMTLYYVQVAADVEAPDLGLSLPIRFPNGWGEDEGRHQAKGDENDLIQMSSSMLTLTVSRLQRDVSGTFDRIGFDNILEHVIDTNEIKDQYGIQLPHSPKEFLSIDIANINKQIGIEVDGPGHFVRLIDNPGNKLSTRSSLKHQFDDRGENRVNGPTILKHRLLTHLGWDIIHLPYWEYQGLGGDKDQEMDYCQNLLDQTPKW